MYRESFTTPPVERTIPHTASLELHDPELSTYPTVTEISKRISESEEIVHNLHGFLGRKESEAPSKFAALTRMQYVLTADHAFFTQLIEHPDPLVRGHVRTLMSEVDRERIVVEIKRLELAKWELYGTNPKQASVYTEHISKRVAQLQTATHTLLVALQRELEVLQSVDTPQVHERAAAVIQDIKMYTDECGTNTQQT
jgi:hypothetical protein